LFSFSNPETMTDEGSPEIGGKSEQETEMSPPHVVGGLRLVVVESISCKRTLVPVVPLLAAMYFLFDIKLSL